MLLLLFLEAEIRRQLGTKVHGVKDTTSFVRKDQIKKPSADYNLEEWIEFKNDSLKTDFNNFERHPHDPLLSEITNSSIESNMHLGTT